MTTKERDKIARLKKLNNRTKEEIKVYDALRYFNNHPNIYRPTLRHIQYQSQKLHIKANKTNQKKMTQWIQLHPHLKDSVVQQDEIFRRWVMVYIFWTIHKVEAPMSNYIIYLTNIATKKVGFPATGYSYYRSKPKVREVVFEDFCKLGLFQIIMKVGNYWIATNQEKLDDIPKWYQR